MSDLVPSEFDNIEQLKDAIADACELGMTLDKAMLFAGATDRQIEFLAQNKPFAERIARCFARAEYVLLDLQEQAMKRQVAKGLSQGVQWKLERINSSRWAAQKQIDQDTNLVIRFDPVDMGVL